MGRGIPINPNPPRPTSQPAQYTPPPTRKNTPQEQTLEFLRQGVMALKPKPLPNPPQPGLLQAHINANQSLHIAIGNWLKTLKNIKEKTEVELRQESESFEKAMDGMEKLLGDVLVIPQKSKNNARETLMNREQHLHLLLANTEDYYEKLAENSANADTLGLFATIFYERASKPQYNQADKYVLATFFKQPSNKPISPFLAELMFNYLLDLTLRFPKEINTDFLRPMKALNDYFMTQPKGIPGLYSHLSIVQSPHCERLCHIWGEMVKKFPFNVALPVVFGEEGCRALAEWCSTYFLNNEEAVTKDIELVELFNDKFGARFKDALSKIKRVTN